MFFLKTECSKVFFHISQLNRKNVQRNDQQVHTEQQNILLHLLWINHNVQLYKSVVIKSKLIKIFPYYCCILAQTWTKRLQFPLTRY